MNIPRMALLSIALLLSACGGGASSGAVDLPQATLQFVQGVNHAYFPLHEGTLRVYEGMSNGEAHREEVRTLPDAQVIDGVSCTAVEQRVYADTQLTEVTTEWYAQDAEGNVWKFGEQSYEVVDGISQPETSASWVSGAHGHEAWIAFTNDPIPGDQYTGSTPEGTEVFVVTSISQTVAVPAGVFANCMEMAENAEDEDDPDIILYARGVGRVSESNANTAIHLTQVQPN